MAETAGIAWHVTGQRLTTQLTNAGSGFQDVWEVTYQIDSGPATGHVGQVNIPAAQYTADVVKVAIANQAANLHAVANL